MWDGNSGKYITWLICTFKTKYAAKGCMERERESTGWFLYTVKLGYNELGYNELGYNELGYNELGYNEHSVITNKIFSPKWLFYYINQPGYNEPRLHRTNWVGPELFVITEFDCIYLFIDVWAHKTK